MHLYVSGEFDDGSLGDDDLGAVFSRNLTTGLLSFVEVIPPFLDLTGDFECLGVSGGGGIAASPAGDRIYVTESWHSVLLVYSRDSGNGRLTLLESHCEFLSGQGNVNRVVVGPAGTNVYTTGLDATITVFGPPSGTDTDGDGIPDAIDNCIEIANADQRDTNGDGFGNACDPDFNGDGVVNFLDLLEIRVAFFSTPASPLWDEDVDLDGNGSINFADLAIMRSFFFGAPGP